MKTTLVVLLFIGLTMSARGQDATASMSPVEVTAGKSITVTITVNGVPSLAQTSLSATLGPKDPKDGGQAFSFNLGQKGNDSTIYTGTTMVPPNSKGIWSLQEVRLNVPLESSRVLETNHPEFKIKPIEVTLPTKGKAEITIPQ